MFFCGAALTLGFNALLGTNPSHHVFELRVYHVNHGKTEPLQARFRDHTDAIFKRYNMKSIGYWVPEDEPASQNVFIYILEHPSRQEAEKNWAAFQADPEWKKEGRVGGARGTGGSYRSLFHGSDQLFSAQLR